MQVGDCLDEAEPEAASSCRAALVEPVETAEDLVSFAGGNAGAAIGDRDDGAAALAAERNRDLGSGRAVVDRVLHQVGDQLRQQIAVAPDERGTALRDIKRHQRVFGDIDIDLGNDGKHGVDIGRLETLLAGAGLDLGNAQQRLEGDVDPVALVSRFVKQSRNIRLLVVACHRSIQRQAQSIERRLQIMHRVDRSEEEKVMNKNNWKAGLRAKLEHLVDDCVVAGARQQDVFDTIIKEIGNLRAALERDPDPAEDDVAVIEEPANDWPAADR